ncbi:hypothetical protein AX17_006199 [Amanita inopinata Kibby_2008]|nr:hypothetical protein AX17_006199 [Amanita inopinata Kibby_2008]
MDHQEQLCCTAATFLPLLKKLVQTPEYFTPNDLKLALDHLFIPNILHQAQVGAFLTALHIHRLERRPEFLAAAASVLRERALTAAVQNSEEDFVVDIVGTGGDGHNLFNVSTAAAVVAAGAGARVIKHGGRASTSSAGSADLLEALDCPFTVPTPGTPMLIPRLPFTFILAPHYHPALAAVIPYRRALPFRTMFNVLGPLINPARPRGMVLGVAEPEIGYTFAQSIQEGGVERAFVVCGCEKLDEISCAGPTRVWEVRDGSITEKIIRPEDFGLPRHPLSSVASGTAKQNAADLKALLTSGDNIPESKIPLLHFVLLNASALLVVAGIAKDFAHGTMVARESITSGKAWAALEQFRDAAKSTTF